MKELDYNYIKRQILALTNVDLNCYKAPQVQRRLKAYLARSAYPNWPKVFRAIRVDSVALSKFKDYLTINVSSFFRDPEKYKTLRTSVLPELLRSRRRLRVWSAGCSRGQEAYSLAMLVAEAVASSGYQYRILATDLDLSALKWARAGGPYSADDVANVPVNLRLRYLDVHNNEYWAKEKLRRMVIFNQHNLLADPIGGPFDLIVCRNVVIYFQPEAKDKLYRRFYDALRPGGVLFVGGTEIVPKPANIGFTTTGISFYRRQDTRPTRLKSVTGRLKVLNGLP